jgi:FemAB-related protein (PEP-CTERM system-associated)
MQVASEPLADGKVVTLDDVGVAAWNAYVEAHPAATFFHLAEWRQWLADVYGHRAYFLAYQCAGRVVGILPLAEVRSLLFGHSLCSLPFCVYGGAVADTPAIARLLEDHAAGLADRRGVDHLELRNLDGARDDWPGKELYVTFRKAILPDPEANLLAIPRKQRAVVRKGMEAGLTSVIDDDIQRFFPIYATSVRNHGTPVFPRRHFSRLLELFGSRCEVTTVVNTDGVALSSVMSFYFRDEVLPYYGGGLVEARNQKAFDFMYWEVLRRAAGRGLQTFDYGRSKLGTGSFSFKKNWGFEPQPLPYRYHLVKRKAVPDINPLNPRFQLFIAGWRRLPVPVANFLGPWLSRSLG